MYAIISGKFTIAPGSIQNTIATLCQNKDRLIEALDTASHMKSYDEQQFYKL